MLFRARGGGGGGLKASDKGRRKARGSGGCGAEVQGVCVEEGGWDQAGGNGAGRVVVGAQTASTAHEEKVLVPGARQVWERSIQLQLRL